MTRPLRLLAGLAALAVATTIAACGSTSPAASTATVGGGSTSTSPTLAFSRCMRAHGVPNFPDLSGGGMRIEANGQSLSVNGVTVSAPAFGAARVTCQRYLPHGSASPAQARQQQASSLKFAACMRSHGVPNFPDPKFVTRGGQQAVYLGNSVDFQSPAFQAGAKACGFGPKGK